ncbi:MAG: ABC transporter ATP-binding protein [Firmicutes bacterium]|nr:ABC transporter ATP-binding protein [Bacillota bacterium]
MLRCIDLVKQFRLQRGWSSVAITVLNHVSLSVGPNQVLCIVGESGCGKTTLGKTLAGLLPPTRGQVLVDEESLFDQRQKPVASAALKVQMVHQDPFSALNPVHTVYEELSLPLKYHHLVPARQITEECERLLTLTGLEPNAVLHKYPHELSGGQRQRVVLARALAVRPRYLIADEAVSMVDVSSRLIMLDLFLSIAEKEQIGLVFITHDFGLARYVAVDGTIAVMYLGRIVELGPTETVIHQPQHPYTQILLSSIPPLQAGEGFTVSKLTPKSFDVPSLELLPPGCGFEPRCPLAFGPCRQSPPSLTRLSQDPSHEVACYGTTTASAAS